MLTFGLVLAAAFGIAVFEGGQSTQATAAAAVVVWWALGVALLVGYRLQRPARPALLALGALVVLALLTGLSVAWAADDGRVVVGLVRALLYVGLFALLLAVAGAGRSRELLAGIAAALAGVALLALGARFLPELLSGDRAFLEQFPQARLGRLSYPVGYWNGLAALMAAALVLLGWLATAGGTRAVRALAVGAIPPVILTLYLTGSRGGVIAAVVGLAAFLALTPVRGRALAGVALGGAGGIALALIASDDQGLVEGALERSAEWGMLAATLAVSVAAAALRAGLDRRLALPELPRLLDRRASAVMVVAAVGALLVLADPVERLEEFERESVTATGRGEFTGRFLSASGNGRYQLWETALDAAAEKPLHGIGAGAFGFYWNRNGTVAEPVRDAHSLFAESLAELGPLGLLAAVALFGAALWAARRATFGDRDGRVAAAAGVVAAGGVGIAIDWTWEIPLLAAVTLAAVATLCAAAGPRQAGPRAGRPAVALRAGGLVVAVAVALLAGSVYLSELALDRSDDRVVDGDLGAAAAAARDAASLRPGSAEPWIQLAEVQFLAGDLHAAQRSWEQAVQRSPHHPEANLSLLLLYRLNDDPRMTAQQRYAESLLPADR